MGTEREGGVGRGSFELLGAQKSSSGRLEVRWGAPSPLRALDGPWVG